MKTILAALLFGAVAFYAMAWADPTPTTQPAASQPVAVTVAPDAPVADQVSSIVKLFKGHEYKLAIAGVLTFVLFLWRRFGSKFLLAKIPAKHMAWVTALIGLLTALPAHLMTTPFIWWKFLIDGFIVGAEAALLWSTIGKVILPKVFGELPEATTK